MALFLTILLSLLSAGMLAGRVFELLNITDYSTGFLVANGIVFNPYIMAVFAVITLCCGVIIFGGNNTVKAYYSKSSKYTAILAGVALATAGVMSFNTDKVAVFFIIGGLALILMGFANLGNSKLDFIVILLFVVFAAGLFLDIVIFDVYTIHNTAFLQKSLAYLAIIAFWLTVLKNYYVPAKNSRMFLYILGVIAFVFCTMMSIANIICNVLRETYILSELVKDISIALFGFYAFDNAVSVIPNGKENIVQPAAETEQTAEDNKNEDSATEVFSEDMAEEKTEEPTIEESEEPTTEEKTAEPQIDAEAEDTQNSRLQIFDIEEIAKEITEAKEQVFDNIGIDEEAVISEELISLPKATEEISENRDYDMLKMLFGGEISDSDALQPEKNHTFETSNVRSFKKVSVPVHDETSSHYDMLKSMFRGEDTSQFQLAQVDEQQEKPADTPQEKQNEPDQEKVSVQIVEQNNEQPKEEKRSLFSKSKKQADSTDNKTDTPKTYKKTIFTSDGNKQAKSKTEKVVYKKPR